MSSHSSPNLDQSEGSGNVKRVTATPSALRLIAQLEARHGPLMFHQSGGCCDGSSPMCYPQNEFRVGGNDVLLGDEPSQQPPN